MSLTNELRIGNWVEILGDSERLDFFTTIQPSSFSVNIDKTYGPIPLDEDWLLKFGFRKAMEKDNYVTYSNSNKRIGVYHNYFIMRGHGATFKYVHQLQNLYFALTETELQFNNDQPNL
jgi:hypothetical protein